MSRPARTMPGKLPATRGTPYPAVRCESVARRQGGRKLDPSRVFPQLAGRLFAELDLHFCAGPAAFQDERSGLKTAPGRPTPRFLLPFSMTDSFISWFGVFALCAVRLS